LEEKDFEGARPESQENVVLEDSRHEGGTDDGGGRDGGDGGSDEEANEGRDEAVVVEGLVPWTTGKG
jgi:hypothetical protein